MIILALQKEWRAKRPKGGKTGMNKYELALVVNAKIEDEARAADCGKSKRLHRPLQRKCNRS